MPQSPSTVKQLDFVHCVIKSGVLKIEHFKHKKYSDMKQKYWQAIHKYAQELGLTTSKDFMRSRNNIWRLLKKNAQESLILLRKKEIHRLSELDKAVLIGLGLTEAELNALEVDSPHFNESLAIVKRERSLNTEVILSDDDTRHEGDEWHERLEQRKLQKKYLQGKILINRLKAYKLIKDLNLPLNKEFLSEEDLEL